MDDRIIYPRITAPINTPPQTPEQAAKGESTTTMVFDNDVHLTLDTNLSVYYPKGTHEVPTRYASHWYLSAHNARPYHRPLSIGEQLAAGVPTGSGKGKRNK